jgi:hypothetical protein
MNGTALKAGETDPWARSLAFHSVLRDGRRVRVRPISPGDKGRMVDALLAMSARSRYLRFHEDRTAFTDAELRYLTELDYCRHVAWGALAPDEPGQPAVAVARFIREADEDAAEFSITVVDAWQGVGSVRDGRTFAACVGAELGRVSRSAEAGRALRPTQPGAPASHRVRDGGGRPEVGPDAELRDRAGHAGPCGAVHGPRGIAVHVDQHRIPRAPGHLIAVEPQPARTVVEGEDLTVGIDREHGPLDSRPADDRPAGRLARPRGERGAGGCAELGPRGGLEPWRRRRLAGRVSPAAEAAQREHHRQEERVAVSFHGLR